MRPCRVWPPWCLCNRYPEATGERVYLESVAAVCHECVPGMKVPFFVLVVHTRFLYFADTC